MDPQTLIESMFSGIIQGITELLPISSSGHLLLFSELFNIDLSLTEVAALHLGTVVAIVLVMRDSIKETCNRGALTNILISIIPAGVIGLLFAGTIENTFGSSTIIISTLIFWGVMLILADSQAKGKKTTDRNISNVTTGQAITIGLAQILAFIPGTSRSGVTVIAGIFSGLSAETALAFSFLSGIPLPALSGAYGFFDVIAETGTATLPSLLTATLIATIVGIFTALMFKTRISKGILTHAGIYRIGIGLLLFLLLL